MDEDPRERRRKDRELLERLRRSEPVTLGALAELVGRPPPPEGAGAVRGRLSKWVGTSREADANRARRLERDGAILGYRAVLDPARLDLDHLGFVQIALDAFDEETLERFREAVRAVPEIERCHMTLGAFHYLLQVRTKDLAAFRALLTGALAALPAVSRMEATVALETVKEA